MFLKGLRDHFLISKQLEEAYLASDIDHELRAMEKPSDHCPVLNVLDLDLELVSNLENLMLSIHQHTFGINQKT